MTFSEAMTSNDPSPCRTPDHFQGSEDFACQVGYTAASGPENLGGLFAPVVVDGVRNTAGGFQTVVLGGQNVTDNNDFSIAPQPPFP
jgi:hypothetical protein